MGSSRLADAAAESFYREALGFLVNCDVPFMVGGAYALKHYTGVYRQTKDLDVFVLPKDCDQLLACLESAGYKTEVTDPRWLAKAFHGENFVDVIFSSGNGVVRIDQEWLDHAPKVRLFEWQIKLVPVEEMIWSKAFIQERERYDGADVTHLILRCGRRIDWRRLLTRFDDHWEILLAYLVLFLYCYPADRTIVPSWLLEELQRRLRAIQRTPVPAKRISRGVLISKTQYAIDVEEWGYQPPPMDGSG